MRRSLTHIVSNNSPNVLKSDNKSSGPSPKAATAMYHLADFHCSKWREFIVANGGFLLYDLAVLSTGQERVRGKDAYLSEFDKSYRDAHSHL